MNINSGLSEDYLDKLKSELLTAKTAYNTYAQAATKARKEHALAILYHNDLKGYCRQVSTTYVMVGDAYSYVGTLLNHANDLSKVMELSHKSLGVIAQFLKCLCEEAEGLHTSIRTLIDAVNGIGDGILTSDGATLPGCLSELETEVSTAITEICAAIKVMIDLYRCLLDLTHGIGSKGENGEASTGLVNDLQQINAVLCCEYQAGISAGLPACEGDELTTGAETELAICCPGDDNIEDRECSLPDPAICEGELFENEFFSTYITEAMEKARLLEEQKKCVLRFYEKKSAGALAKMEAVDKALTAATKAKELCK